MTPPIDRGRVKEEMPTPEAIALLARWRDYPISSFYDGTVAEEIDRFAAQRGAELCERLEREFGIPKLILLGQAKEAAPTDADIEWADDIISQWADKGSGATHWYRVVEHDGGYEPQILYNAGAVKKLVWFPLNAQGYWLEPDAYSYGNVTQHAPLPTRGEAERAIERAKLINADKAVVRPSIEGE